MAACYPCDREAEFHQLPPRETVAWDDHWRVAMATGTTLPGWVVLLPRRHVMEIAELHEAEQATLGRWQVWLARALAGEFDVPKVYSVAFGELPGFHLHFHLIPRADELTPEYAGPSIFGLLGQQETPELLAARDDYARRLARWLA